MIKNLSPSRASQFKTCPKQFKYANVDKILEPTNEVQAKGTTVHQALEDLFDLPSEERTIEKLHNLFREAWTKVRGNDEHHNLFSSIEEERDWGLEGLKLLNNYMTLEDPRSFEPVERERWVRGTIEDLNLRGILDRMDRNDNGELIIVDYKSGKAPLAKYKEPRFFALKLYALLIKEETGEMPVELKLIYLQNSTIHTLKIDNEILEQAKQEILEVWNNIKIAFQNNEFPPIKNALCDWCYYKPICPIYNPDAPDTSKLQEINDQIEDMEQQIEAYELISTPEEIPSDSPIANTNVKELEENISLLNSKKEAILENIEKLLREKASS